MLRLRDTNGKAWELPDSVNFIEVCDEEGNIAAVVHRLGKQRVAVYTKGDESFARYMATYKIKPTQIVKI